MLMMARGMRQGLQIEGLQSAQILRLDEVNGLVIFVWSSEADACAMASVEVKFALRLGQFMNSPLGVRIAGPAIWMFRGMAFNTLPCFMQVTTLSSEAHKSLTFQRRADQIAELHLERLGELAWLETFRVDDMAVINITAYVSQAAMESTGPVAMAAIAEIHEPIQGCTETKRGSVAVHLSVATHLGAGTAVSNPPERAIEAIVEPVDGAALSKSSTSRVVQGNRDDASSDECVVEACGPQDPESVSGSSNPARLPVDARSATAEAVLFGDGAMPGPRRPAVATEESRAAPCQCRACW